MTPFDFIVRDHFRPVPDRDEAMGLFRRSVRMVEIEVFSYCNRACWFCPNSVVDRRSTTEYMPEQLYLRVLEQLAEADYHGMISYSRYNEPLADRIILRRIEQARTLVPEATLHTNTNGDYLTPGYLDDLASAGLRSLSIQIYLGNEDRYDHDRMRTKLQQTIEKLQLAATLVTDDPGTWLEATSSHRGIRVRLYARNFEVNGCSRGDSVPIALSARRTSPCLSPFHDVYIDYNGKVMPCCNLRSDLPAHRDAVVADLHDVPDLFAVYASETMAAWRRSLVGFGPKSGHCSSCSFVPYADTPEHRAVHERLLHDAARAGDALCLSHR
jgi:MoaA/NifB/PqqE/SkfB family radical SAM enzyme